MPAEYNRFSCLTLRSVLWTYLRLFFFSYLTFGKAIFLCLRGEEKNIETWGQWQRSSRSLLIKETTYQITKSHTLAHTHSWLPETNKYKHDLALSPRKITVVSWCTVGTARSQTLTPTRAPVAENGGCEEEAMELEGLRLRYEIRRKAVCLTFTPRLAWWTSFSGHASKHLATQATRPNWEPCRSARSVRPASQLTGLWLTPNEHLRSHFSTCP